ncbi:MAG TPA: RNA polymerase sigma factor [Polyangiaceae bacterium]|nr:RNA polymerase sigma factor [Polyangiaceae bacterium]
MTTGLPLTSQKRPATERTLRSDQGHNPLDISEVFREHGAYVWRALRHLGVREADLADVTQDVFIVAHRKLDAFEGRSSLQTWLYGICLRTASDYRRRAYVRREVAVEEVPEIATEPPQSAVVERRQLRARLLALLDALDADKREVVVLYEIEELPMKQVAEVIGVPLQTAYSRLHAARRQLAEALGEEAE